MTSGDEAEENESKYDPTEESNGEEGQQNLGMKRSNQPKVRIKRMEMIGTVEDEDEEEEDKQSTESNDS